jgi:hypothetical protein
MNPFSRPASNHTEVEWAFEEIREDGNDVEPLHDLLIQFAQTLRQIDD